MKKNKKMIRSTFALAATIRGGSGKHGDKRKRRNKSTTSGMGGNNGVYV